MGDSNKVTSSVMGWTSTEKRLVRNGVYVYALRIRDATSSLEKKDSYT